MRCTEGPAVVLGCPFHSEAEAGKDGMKIDYEREASIIMLSAVKFVHPWETNSGCTKEVCRWKHLINAYVAIECRQWLWQLNRQCTESLTKHSFVVCTSSSAQLDVV